MAQKYDITTRLSRRALAVRREPYWHRLEAGGYIGYRRSQRDEHGQWIGRWRDKETGQQHYHALGFFHDFDPAKQACEKWLKHIKLAGRTEVITVLDAMLHYANSLDTKGKPKTAVDTRTRIKAYIDGKPIAGKALDDLRSLHVKQWRDSLTGKPATINRTLATLKAGLNLAYKESLVQANSAWNSVDRLEVGDAWSRDRWLTVEERRRLLDNCNPAIANFVRILLLTAARPGEIASAKAADFDKAAGTLRLSGKTGQRVIPLSSAAISLCIECAKDKLPKAPLFTDSKGKMWTSNRWGLEFKEGRKAAGFGGDVILYTLRHTAISEMIQSGMDAFSVAKMAGTSTIMIDRHYGHLAASRTRAQLNAVDML